MTLYGMVTAAQHSLPFDSCGFRIEGREDEDGEKEPCSWLLQGVRVVRMSDHAEWRFPASFQTLPLLLRDAASAGLQHEEEETVLYVDLQVP